MTLSEFNEDLLNLPARPLSDSEIRQFAAKLITLQNCDEFIFGRSAMMHLIGDEQGASTWRKLASAVQAIRKAPQV